MKELSEYVRNQQTIGARKELWKELQEQMEEIMGISARRLEESPSEGMVQLVFVNGGQIVCGVCGYISKEGYSVSFDEKINFADNVVFRAKRDADGILWLTEPHD